MHTTKDSKIGKKKMIPIMSNHVIRKGRQTEIIAIIQEEQTILNRLCHVSIAVTRSSSGGEYVTIVYLYSDYPRYDYASCNCQGWFFKGICGHIAAVVDKARDNRV